MESALSNITAIFLHFKNLQVSQFQSMYQFIDVNMNLALSFTSSLCSTFFSASEVCPTESQQVCLNSEYHILTCQQPQKEERDKRWFILLHCLAEKKIFLSSDPEDFPLLSLVKTGSYAHLKMNHW